MHLNDSQTIVNLPFPIHKIEDSLSKFRRGFKSQQIIGHHNEILLYQIIPIFHNLKHIGVKLNKEFITVIIFKVSIYKAKRFLHYLKVACF